MFDAGDVIRDGVPCGIEEGSGDVDDAVLSGGEADESAEGSVEVLEACQSVFEDGVVDAEVWIIVLKRPVEIEILELRCVC